MLQKGTPKYAYSDKTCPGLKEAVYEYLLDTNEWDDGVHVIEWPEPTGQLVWYMASFDGQECHVNACGMAYPLA